MMQNQFNQPQQVQSKTNEILFKADNETLEIISKTYPELREALINIAIKKFSKDPEYLNYFTMQEYREKLTQETAQQNDQNLITNTSSVQPAQNNIQTQQPTATAAIDLSAGW